MTYIDQTPDKETKVSLIKTLETVTEGKVSAGKLSTDASRTGRAAGTQS